MNCKLNDFEKFALSKGIGTNTLHGYSNYVNPMILEERRMNVTAIDIYSRLMYDKIIFLGTHIDSEVANIVNAQLLYLNTITDKDEDIKMFINSYGGECLAGLAIYDTMNFVGPDVSTYCMGVAASMGSIIMSSGAKGKRYSLPNSTIMLHQVSTATGRISTADLKIEYDEAKRIQNTLYNILSKNSGKTFEEIEKDADRDHWLVPKNCLPGVYGEYGLIDEIIVKQK